MSTTIQQLFNFIEEIKLADERLDEIKEEEEAKQTNINGVPATESDVSSREQVEAVLRKTMTVVFPIVDEVPRGEEGQPSVRHQGPRTVIDKSFVQLYRMTMDILKAENAVIPIFIPWLARSPKTRQPWIKILHRLIEYNIDTYTRFASVTFLKHGEVSPPSLDLASPRTLIITDWMDVSKYTDDAKCKASVVGFCALEANFRKRTVHKRSFIPLSGSVWSEKLLPNMETFQCLIESADGYHEQMGCTMEDLYGYFGGDVDCPVFPGNPSYISARRKVIEMLRPGMTLVIEKLNEFVNKVRFDDLEIRPIPDDFGQWIILSRPFEEDLTVGGRQDYVENVSPSGNVSESQINSSPPRPLTTLGPSSLPSLRRSFIAPLEDRNDDRIFASNLCFPSIFAIASQRVIFKLLNLNMTPSGLYQIDGTFLVSNACKVFYSLVEAYRLANHSTTFQRKRWWHLTGMYGTGKTTILLICACAWLLQPEKYRIVHIAKPSYMFGGRVDFADMFKTYVTFAFSGDPIASQIQRADFKSLEIYQIIDDYLVKNGLLLVVVVDQLNEIQFGEDKKLFSDYEDVVFNLTKACFHNILVITSASMNNEHQRKHGNAVLRIDILNGFNEKEAKALERIFDPEEKFSDFAIDALGCRPIDLNFTIDASNLEERDENAPSHISVDLIVARMKTLEEAAWCSMDDFMQSATKKKELRMRPIKAIVNRQFGLFNNLIIDKRYMTRVFIPKPTPDSFALFDPISLSNLDSEYKDVYSLLEYERLLSQASFRQKMTGPLTSMIVPCNSIVWSAAFSIYSESQKKKKKKWKKSLKRARYLDKIEMGLALETIFFSEIRHFCFDKSGGRVFKCYNVNPLNDDAQVTFIRGARAVDTVRLFGKIKGVTSPISLKAMMPGFENLDIPVRLISNGLRADRSFIIQCNPMQSAVDFVIVLDMTQVYLVQVGFLSNRDKAMEKMLKAAATCHRDAAKMFPVLFKDVANLIVNYILYCIIDPFSMPQSGPGSRRLLESGELEYKPDGQKNMANLKYIAENKNEINMFLMLPEDNSGILKHTMELKTFVMGSLLAVIDEALE